MWYCFVLMYDSWVNSNWCWSKVMRLCVRVVVRRCWTRFELKSHDMCSICVEHWTASSTRHQQTLPYRDFAFPKTNAIYHKHIRPLSVECIASNKYTIVNMFCPRNPIDHAMVRRRVQCCVPVSISIRRSNIKMKRESRKGKEKSPHSVRLRCKSRLGFKNSSKNHL